MKDETVNGIPVNDGGGLLDNLGLIDSLIVDCNELPKTLMMGQYVLFCSQIVQMVQKLGNLKQGVKDDLSARDERIEEQRQQIDRLLGGGQDGMEH